MPTRNIVRFSGHTLFSLLFIVILAFLSVYSAFSGHFFANSYDGMVHIARIESVFQAVKNFRVPSLINFIGFGHQGLALNAMYPWITLLIFVIPKVILHNVILAFASGFFILNLITIFNTYLLAKYLSDDSWVQWLGVFAYQFNAYHLQVMYARVALGEAFGYAFLPLVLLGLFKIWNHEKSGILYVAFGMSLIANSHVLSLVMAAMFILVVEIIRILQIKASWSEVRFLMYSALLAIVMSIYSIYNIIVFTFYNKMVSPAPSVIALDPGISFSKMMSNDFTQSGNGANMGFAIMMLLGILLISMSQISKPENWSPWILSSVVMLILLQDWFPWSRLIGTPVQLFQFLMRFLVLVAICFTVGLILFFNRTSTAVRPFMVVMSMFIFFIGTMGTYQLHQRFRENYLWAKKHTKPSIKVKTDKLHYLTSNNYEANTGDRQLYEYHLEKSNSVGKVSYKTSGAELIHLNNLRANFDFKGAESFKNLKATDQEAVFGFKQKHARVVKIPVVGYKNVDFSVKVNGKKTVFWRSEGQLKTKLPAGSSKILVSVADSSKHIGLLVISVIGYLFGIFSLILLWMKRGDYDDNVVDY
ncbi:hypothetical protein IV79_GL000534 [Pediococcus claussenii]|nr:hypothetical protein IV79_GL000534 [Pediococcus claussenii]